MTAFYLLVDASGQGFGSGLWDHEGLIYDSDNWSTQWKKDTYNWREGTNLTVQVEELAKDKKLENGRLFILTDNQVFEGFLYKGHSKPQKINKWVLRLILVDMETGCILHVIHVAGTQMKQSGIYGLY